MLRLRRLRELNIDKLLNVASWLLLRLVSVGARCPSVITRILGLLEILALAGTGLAWVLLLHHLGGGCGGRCVLLVELVSVLLLKYAVVL